jgi:hypothetical protein
MRARYVRSFAGPICSNCGERQEQGHFFRDPFNDMSYYSCAAKVGGMKDTTVVGMAEAADGYTVTLESADPLISGFEMRKVTAYIPKSAL